MLEKLGKLVLKPSPLPETVETDLTAIEVMGLVTQMSIARNTQMSMMLEMSKIPAKTLSFNLHITDRVLILRPDPPWISYSIANGSAQAILTGVAVSGANLSVNAAPLEQDEVLNVDITYPIISMLLFKTTLRGTTADIRVRAKEGNRLLAENAVRIKSLGGRSWL